MTRFFNLYSSRRRNRILIFARKAFSVRIYMRRISAICLLIICLVVRADAQQAMIGLRQGGSLWLTKSGLGQGTLKYADGQHFTWDKELFFRDAILKKWYFETGISNFSFNNTTTTGDQATISVKSNVIKTNFSLQYDVTYPLLGYIFPRMGGMKSYIGFNVSPMIAFNKYNTTGADSLLSVRKDVNVRLMVGFSYTHIIPLSPRVSITSVLSFNTGFYSKYVPLTANTHANKSISWMSGISYNL